MDEALEQTFAVVAPPLGRIQHRDDPLARREVRRLRACRVLSPLPGVLVTPSEEDQPMAATVHSHRTVSRSTRSVSARAGSVRSGPAPTVLARRCSLRADPLGDSPGRAPEELLDADWLGGEDLSHLPGLRAIDGGHSPRSVRQRRLYRRRRAAVALVLIVFVALAWQGLVGVSSLLADPAPDVVPARPTAAPLSGSVYVVRSGDNLWSIARRVAPGEDPRPFVDELSRRLDGAALHAGQRIDIDGLAG